MTEYWLISAPGDKTCQQTWETMNHATAKAQLLSSNYKFHIPDLKVGTLDQLVGLSDDLGKLDAAVEQSTRKLAAYMGEVLEDQRDKLHENLQANNKKKKKEYREKIVGLGCNGLGQTSMDDDGDGTSFDGGPDTPPNTPVTPSHNKNNKEQHNRLWKDTDKYDQEPAPSLGQHHQRHHHQSHHNHSYYHDNYQYQYQNHNHNHHQNHHHNHSHNQNHHSNSDKKSSINSQSNCEVRTQNDSSIYSCYHTHWCAASSSPSPTPTPTSPTSPCPSLSSDWSSDGEYSTRRNAHHRRKALRLSHRSTSTSSKLIGDYDDNNATDEDQIHEQEQDEDDSGILPNPGTHPTNRLDKFI